VKTQLHVVKRKGSDVYYFRARIPADLQPHFGKAEAWVSYMTVARCRVLERFWRSFSGIIE